MINEIHDERYRLRIVSTDVKSVGYDENGDIHVSFGLFRSRFVGASLGFNISFTSVNEKMG